MRIIFMGTPEFSVPALEQLHAAGHDICAVYTRPPAKKGRGMAEQTSPVHQAALALGVPVLTPTSFKSTAEIEQLAAFQADLCVVVAYGLILPQAVLDIPQYGCWNIHASLLPRWRGAAPIQRAIMAGDTQTGICIMQMEAGLDTGPVLLQNSLPIHALDTAQDLHDKLMFMGAQEIVKAVAMQGRLIPQIQSETGVTYADKISKQEAQIDWSQSAQQICQHIHGLSPFPGAWTQAGETRLKILQAETVALAADKAPAQAGEVLDDMALIACGQGAIRPVRVQRAGKPAMALADFQRGAGLDKGVILS